MSYLLQGLDEHEVLGKRTLFHWCCGKPMYRIIEILTSDNGYKVKVCKEHVGWLCKRCNWRRDRGSSHGDFCGVA